MDILGLLKYLPRTEPGAGCSLLKPCIHSPQGPAVPPWHFLVQWPCLASLTIMRPACPWMELIWVLPFWFFGQRKQRQYPCSSQGSAPETKKSACFGRLYKEVLENMCLYCYLCCNHFQEKVFVMLYRCYR